MLAIINEVLTAHAHEGSVDRARRLLRDLGLNTHQPKPAAVNEATLTPLVPGRNVRRGARIPVGLSMNVAVEAGQNGLSQSQRWVDTRFFAFPGPNSTMVKYTEGIEESIDGMEAQLDLMALGESQNIVTITSLFIRQGGVSYDFPGVLLRPGSLTELQRWDIPEAIGPLMHQMHNLRVLNRVQQNATQEG